MIKIISLLIVIILAVVTINAQELGEFNDKRDQHVYKTVKIGEQIWMAENLAFKKKGKYTWVYNNNSSKLEEYGYLYNWKTSKKVCPKGWHLPTKEEFESLLDNYGGTSKSEVWDKKSSYTALINKGKSGFSVIQAGMRNYEGQFDYEGIHATFWTATDAGSGAIWQLEFNGITKEAEIVGREKVYGLSVRCVKN